MVVIPNDVKLFNYQLAFNWLLHDPTLSNVYELSYKQ